MAMMSRKTIMSSKIHRGPVQEVGGGSSTHSGIRANQNTFSAIINSVLRRAQSLEYLALGEHAVKKMGLKTAAHIQIMFIGFHFKQADLDLDADELLIEKFKRQRL